MPARENSDLRGDVAVMREHDCTEVKALKAEVERLREALERCHDTLHECTAVLTASDCAKVAAVMTDARRALGKEQS